MTTTQSRLNLSRAAQLALSMFLTAAYAFTAYAGCDDPGAICDAAGREIHFGEAGPRLIWPLPEGYNPAFGWKIHLTVQPKNYAAVDEWVYMNSGVYVYKHRYGGEIGSKDFTIYLGDFDRTMALAEKIRQSEIYDLIEPSNCLWSDLALDASTKVSARFDHPLLQKIEDEERTYTGQLGMPYSSRQSTLTFRKPFAVQKVQALESFAIFARQYGSYFHSENPAVFDELFAITERNAQASFERRHKVRQIGSPWYHLFAGERERESRPESPFDRALRGKLSAAEVLQEENVGRTTCISAFMKRLQGGK